MSEKQALFFSLNQKRIIAAGGTVLASVFLAATGYWIFLLLRGFVTQFKDVLLPLAIAAILATLLQPIVTFWETRTRLNRTGGIVLLFALVILTIGATAIFVVPSALETADHLLKVTPGLTQKGLVWIEGLAPSIWEWLSRQWGESPREYLVGLLEENTTLMEKTLLHAQSSASSFIGFLSGLFGKIAAYSIIPVYLFFILNRNYSPWNDLDRQLGFLSEARKNDLIFLAREFVDILTAFFRGQIIIGLLLGLVLSIGFSLIGLKFGIVMGFILGLLNIIPYLGTVLGVLLVLPIAYFQQDGGWALVGLNILVLVLGQLLTDYVFTPRIMGKRTGMGPMCILFSIFFWGVALDGLLGMILAIPLTAFFLVFWRLAREKYLPGLTAPQPIPEKSDLPEPESRSGSVGPNA